MRDVFDISTEDLYKYYSIVTYIYIYSIISIGNEINIKITLRLINLEIKKKRKTR
jgi:hypothetical protein